MICIDAFNEIHAAEQKKHRDKLKKEKGNEEYKTTSGIHESI